MKSRSRAACLYAAVAAVSFGIPDANARDLVWDWSPGDGVPHDGTGFWDLASNNWVDQAVPGVNTVWVNGDNAIFGGGTSGAGAEPTPFPYNVDLAAAIVVNNFTLADVPLNQSYSISNFSGGSLTLNGNLSKTGDNGQINFFCDTTLSAGTHVVAMNDTPNDVVEFIFNGLLSGGGNLTVNNGTFQAWGTLSLNRNNTGYTGVTSIEKGRVILTDSGGLGSTAALSGTTISNQGTLGFYGAGTTFAGNLTVSEPITITRSQYSEAAGIDPEFGRYDGAIRSDAGQNVINGPVVLNTVDARIQVNGTALGATDGLTISSNITETSPSKLSKSGGGVLYLTGNNTHTGGTATRGGTIAFTTDANIGGPTSQMFFDGGYFRIPAGWTNFGAHVVDYADWAGGLDTPGASQVFVITENLTGRNFNKRGVGTVNLNGPGTSTFTEDNFTDLGTVNVNTTLNARAIRIRNGTVNVNNGATYNTTGAFTSIGVDAGEDGVLNISGTGIVNASNNDFNISDNAGIAADPSLGTPENRTTGILNISDSAQLNVAGPIFIAKNARTTATLNISGNAVVNANRTGNPSFVIGRGTDAVGLVNKTGGTLAIAGELFVGNDGGGNGTFTQTAGSTTVNNWIAVARNTSTGTVNLDGGTLTKTGGGNVEIDFGGGGNGIFNVRNNAILDVQGGELWVGQAGGSNGQLNVQNAGQVKANNWVAIGRGGGTGTLNLSGTANVSKLTGGGNHFILGDNSTGTANVTQNSSINVVAGELWVGQAGSGNGTLNIQDAGAVTVGNWIAIGRGGATGVVNLSGTGSLTKNAGSGSRLIVGAGGTGTLNQTGGTVTNTVSETWIAENGTSGTWNMSGTAAANLALLNIGRAGGATATLNLDGNSSLQATRVVAGGGTGAKNLNLNGGTLKAGASDTDWMTTGIPVNVKAGGAKLDSNGFDATVNSALLHDAGLGATPDGGVTKNGAGTFNLTGANTYTGPTVVNAGTLGLRRMREVDAVTIAAGAKLKVLDSSPTLPDHPSGDNAFVSRPASLNIAAGGQLDLTNNDLIVDYAGGTSPIEQIEDMIAAGFNGGEWNGPGIISSTALADPNFHLAVAENALLLVPFGDGVGDDPLFSGQVVDDTTVLVKFTHRVDLDLDGLITGNDAAVFNAFFSEGAPATWQFGDLDYDGVYSGNDAAIFNGFYNEALASVPEPAGLALAACGIALLTRRRRRGA